MSIEQQLGELLAEAFSEVAGGLLSEAPVDPQLHASKHADFQADAAMGLASRLHRKPRDIAEAVAELIAEDERLSNVKVAGPGFLNLTLSRGFIESQLKRQFTGTRLGIPLPEPQSIIVDYSSPNVAKEMHVGHLRSTIIGDACVRLLEWQGHNVIRRNHIGDWGTPFGMLITHLLDLGEEIATRTLSVGDLNSFYRAARQKFDADDAFQGRARARVVALQEGDGETLRLWNILIDQSQSYFMDVYDKLDLRLDGSEFYGESAYNELLIPVLDELMAKGLIEKSDGADCVFPTGFFNRDGDRLPLILRKSEGGFGYAITDLAAIRQRTLELKADRILYVVGAPQNQHLEMVFTVARAAGWLTEKCTAEHVAFGSVLGVDGKMFKSRSGDSIRLADLLAEGVSRADAILVDKNPRIDSEERQWVANAVGIGSIKYADLSTDRLRDYVFDFDRMLEFEGNTAPYIQYAHARIHAILRKSSELEDVASFMIDSSSERRLAMKLLVISGVIEEIEKSLNFHRLATYLFELASAFSGFYSSCPVLDEEDSALRKSRLALCLAVAKVLEVGLSILGIRAPQRM